MTERKGGLGRGLGALIPTGPATAEIAVVEGARFAELPLDAIVPNHAQPRQVFDEEALQELEDSIREVGLLQPIIVRPLVRPLDGADGAGRYELIMGERRWRASQRVGLAVIPAIVRETPDTDMLRDALLENLHRSQLNPLEEAAAYQQLLADFGVTHEELAQRIGRSRPQISNTIRLLGLPGTVQSKLAAGVLSAGHARAILGLSSAEAMEALAHRVIAEGLSVRSTEEAVALAGAVLPERHRKQAAKRLVPEAAREVAEQLSDRLETRVKVDVGARKGRITIDFATLEDLQRVADIINGPRP
ncbi:MAG: parB-like partition protein [Frankiales bacterium]|jgi:ParB family chromosome partitioning protein|nr:parB-like partition protein [Frankiales bacterium]